MPLWRIEPCAVATDSRWMDFPIWSDVVVRAASPAQARLVAGAMDAWLHNDQTPVGNETLEFRSGFEDEKLYRVSQLRRLSGTPLEGPDEVIVARQARPAGRV
jgi:hypothetical protein